MVAHLRPKHRSVALTELSRGPGGGASAIGGLVAWGDELVGGGFYGRRRSLDYCLKRREGGAVATGTVLAYMLCSPGGVHSTVCTPCRSPYTGFFS